MIKDCCEHISTAASKKVSIAGEQNLTISADEQLIEQVIVNLVNNAVKYAPGSKEIIVEISSSEGSALVRVTDFGVGIHADKLPFIFERYYRADQSNTSIPGLGLGLYIAAEIIRKHEGKIGVESVVNKETTFWFKLPLQ